MRNKTTANSSGKQCRFTVLSLLACDPAGPASHRNWKRSFVRFGREILRRGLSEWRLLPVQDGDYDHLVRKAHVRCPTAELSRDGEDLVQVDARDTHHAQRAPNPQPYDFPCRNAAFDENDAAQGGGDRCRVAGIEDMGQREQAIADLQGRWMRVPRLRQRPVRSKSWLGGKLRIEGGQVPEPPVRCISKSM